jgi:hypothetical protein
MRQQSAGLYRVALHKTLLIAEYARATQEVADGCFALASTPRPNDFRMCHSRKYFPLSGNPNPGLVTTNELIEASSARPKTTPLPSSEYPDPGDEWAPPWLARIHYAAALVL